MQDFIMHNKFFSWGENINNNTTGKMYHKKLQIESLDKLKVWMKTEFFGPRIVL